MNRRNAPHLWLMYSFTFGLAALSFSPVCFFSPALADIIPIRHAVKPMTMDMRGVPDTQGLCRGQGFQRNESDCTLFYRCVNFSGYLRPTSVYTIFPFMCGPMAVFDESRSLCTGPELAQPPCTNQTQLDELFPPKVTRQPISRYTRHTTPTPSGHTVSTSVAITTKAITTTRRTTTPSTTTPTTTSTRRTTTPTTPHRLSTTTSTTTSTRRTTTPTTPYRLSTTTKNPRTEPEICIGTVTIGDKNPFEIISGTVTENILITANIPFGVIGKDDTGSEIIVQQGESTQIIRLISGTILVMTTTEEGGTVTNIANQLITTETTTTTVPKGTNFIIIKIGSGGKIIRTEKLFTTTDITTIDLPLFSIVGSLIINNLRVTKIGSWTVSTQYLSTTTSVTQTNFLILRLATSTNYSVVSTTTTTITGSSTTVSGIAIIGENVVSTETSDLTTNQGDYYIIVPLSGQGVMTITQEDGTTVTEIVQSGSFYGILFSQSSGSITNVIEQQFTTSSTVITIPVGCTLSTGTIGTNGNLIITKLTEIKTKITITLSTQSYIGNVQTSGDNVITSIGNGEVTIIKLTGYNVYFAVVTIGSVTTFEVSSLKDILFISSSSYIDTEVSGTTEKILGGATYGILVSTDGQVLITEENPTGTKQTKLTVKSGAIIGFLTSTSSSGEITQVQNGIFTSKLTTIKLSPSVVIGILVIYENGTMAIQNSFTTKGKTTIVVPNRSFYGQIIVKSNGVISQWGSAPFFTKYLLVSGSQSGNVPIVLAKYGFISLWQDFETISDLSVFSSGPVSTDVNLESVVGILQISRQTKIKVESSLFVPTDGDLVIFPSKGEGDITINEGGNEVKLTILPGSFLVLLGCKKGIVRNLLGGISTTSSTLVSFDAGTQYGIAIVGNDGQLITDSNLIRRAQSSCTIIFSFECSVGVLERTSANIISKIAGASFTIKTITTRLVSSSYTNTIALWNIDEVVSIPPVTDAPTTTSTTIATTTVATKNDTTNFQTESLTGIITAANPNYLTAVGDEQRIQMIQGTTHAIVVSSGIITIQQNIGNSIRKTNLRLPGGSIFIMVVSTTDGGVANGILNGYFTSPSAKFTFTSGVRCGLGVITNNGSLIIQNTLTTTTTTVISAPSQSMYGLVRRNSEGVVTQIGDAPFSTEIILISESNDNSVPVTLGSFGLIQRPEQLDSQNCLIISSYPLSSLLQTLAGIIIFRAPLTLTTSSLIIPDGSTMVIIPPKGLGSVVVNENGVLSNFPILPGRMFELSNIKRGSVTNLAEGYTVTPDSDLAFSTGTNYGSMTISPDGEVIEQSFSGTAKSKLSILAPIGSTIGIIQTRIGENSRKTIVSIGTAQFVTKAVSSSFTSTGDLASVGILDFINPTNP